MSWGLASVGLTLLLLAGISRLLTDTPVTPAMLVTVAGVMVGPLILDAVTVGPTSETVKRLAEVTLALVLFSDASRIDLRAMRREAFIPLRLLGVGLPITILVGVLAALALFRGFSLSDALILAVILAPTDAGLGSAVVTDRRLPDRIRQSLNVESGLNDGICVPLLLIVLATVSGTGDSSHPIAVIGEQIGYGALAGVTAGALSGRIATAARARETIDEAWSQLLPAAATMLAYGLAFGLGGSGFIAAFVAGAVFGMFGRTAAGGEALLARTCRFTEEAGALLSALTFLVFGAVLLAPALEGATWQAALYAAVSLTIVRMLPVALSLVGTRARAPTVAFLGWFGPRGLASIVFAVIVEDMRLPHSQQILTAAYLTVGLSVLCHGLSAAPLVSRYSTWFARATLDGPLTMESEPSHSHRARGSGGRDGDGRESYAAASGDLPLSR